MKWSNLNLLINIRYLDISNLKIEFLGDLKFKYLYYLDISNNKI